LIDLHIIASKDTPRPWLNQALDTAALAVKSAAFPIALHVIDGVPGHIGMARARGYSLGLFPYATFLDDDDWLEAGAFDGVADALASMPPAILCRENLWQNGLCKPGGAGHHLTIVRRDQLVNHAEWPCCGDVVQNMKAMRDPQSVRLDGYRYNHRLYLSSKARAMRQASPDELEAARG
jgi:hypothetical protein